MKILIKEEVESKDFKKNNRSHYSQILSKIKTLEKFPHITGWKPIKGLGNKIFRLRSVDFRILFSVNAEQNIIVVFAVADRKSIYKKLEKLVTRN